MKKYWLLTLVLSFFAGNVSAFDLPNYEDDAEFKQCTRVSNNWDPCVQEETTRALNKVKQQYRDILHMPQLLAWNGDVVKNTETMRDMYESWIAYRNRLCSLSHSAARYMDPILTEKYSCTLYHTLHHKDHLGKIIKLLQTAPVANRPTNAQNRQPLSINLFRITEHDDAFNKCMEDNKNTKTCWSEENNRTIEQIKELYKNLMADEHVGKWNNGPNLKSGNYRDMFDSWIAYRNRLCSLAAYAYKQSSVRGKISLQGCVLYLNKEHAQRLQNTLEMAGIAMDDGFEDMYDENDPLIEMPVSDNDGGAAEGKTIQPLENRLPDAEESQDLKLSDEGDTPAETAPQDEESVIPAWAREN